MFKMFSEKNAVMSMKNFSKNQSRISSIKIGGAFDSAENRKRQRRKRQSS